MGNSESSDIYVLVVKDDLSCYCWLEPTPSANAENACAILSRWNRTFTTPKLLVSDQGSHFINQLMKNLASALGIIHKPTVAYLPWSNGKVERLNRDIFSATRATLAELKLALQDWKKHYHSTPRR